MGDQAGKILRGLRLCLANGSTFPGIPDVIMVTR
jgi:hypothetical protein